MTMKNNIFWHMTSFTPGQVTGVSEERTLTISTYLSRPSVSASMRASKPQKENGDWKQHELRMNNNWGLQQNNSKNEPINFAISVYACPLFVCLYVTTQEELNKFS
jgi:hypothetical protein